MQYICLKTAVKFFKNCCQLQILEFMVAEPIYSEV